MTIHIALLRGINVGGHAKVAMADLRAFMADLGYPGARTWLQSGNLVFACGDRTGAELETHLEAEAAARLGLVSDFIVRTAKEWDAIVADNPFPDAAERDPSHLVVMAFKAPVDESAVATLQASGRGPELLRADGRNLYIVYPAGIGASQLTNSVIESRLRQRGTARNWNTVRKLQVLASA